MKTQEDFAFLSSSSTFSLPTPRLPGGRKDDPGKRRYDLFPPRPLALLADVYTIGAAKYTERNWEKGIRWGRLFAALMRHAWAWWGGEQYDREGGQHHLASVAWCALSLMEFEATHPELDDRPHREEGNGTAK